MRPDNSAPAKAARRLIGRSRRLDRFVWPSTEDGLRRRRDAAIVVAAAFRVLTGKEPTPSERAHLLRRIKQGLGFDELVDELQARPDAAELAVERAPKAVRRLLERDLGNNPTSAADAERVVLLHIMKTGGTSLSELLRRWAGPGLARVALPLDDLVLMPRPLLARLRAVSGHFPYEALGIIPGRCRTATVLREPVARTLSHYQEILRTQESKQGLTLDEFLESEVYAVPAGNYQARFLAHTIDIPGAWIDYSPMQRYLEARGQPDQPHPLQALFGSTPIFLTDDELLERASANLSRIDVVGTTEQLDVVARRLASVFGVPAETAPRLNTSASTLGPDLPARLRRLIEQRTAVDRELYEMAGRLGAV